MDVRCEKCGTEYEFDEGRIGPGGVTVKCTACEHVFEVFRRGEVPPPRGPSTNIGAGPQGKEWLVRHADGRMVAFRELTTLQKWIIEGRITRDDEISKTAETWKRLGNIKELEPFFAIYDKAQSYDLLINSGDISGKIEDLRQSQILRAVHPSQIDSRGGPRTDDLLAPPIKVQTIESRPPAPVGPVLSHAPEPTGALPPLSSAQAREPTGARPAQEAVRPMSGIKLPAEAAEAPMAKPATPTPKASEDDSHRFEDMGLPSSSAAPAAFPQTGLEFPAEAPPVAPAPRGGSGWIWKLILMLLLGIGVVVAVMVWGEQLMKGGLSSVESIIHEATPEPAREVPEPKDAIAEATRLFLRGQGADLTEAVTQMQLAQGGGLNDDTISAKHAVVMSAQAMLQAGGTRDRSLETARSLLLAPQRGQPAALDTHRAEAMYHFAAKDFSKLRAALKAAGPAATKDALLQWMSAEAILGSAGPKAPKEARTEARAALKAALQIEPKLNFARMRLAELEEADGDRAEARAEVKKILASAPAFGGAAALSKRLEDKPASPEVQSKRAVAKKQSRRMDYETLMELADRLRRRDRAADALKYYQQASRKKRTTEVLIGMGWCYLDLRRTRAAREHFSRAVSASPKSAQAQYGLATVNEYLGHNTEAVAAYKRYIEIAPEGPDAPAVRARLAQLDK